MSGDLDKIRQKYRSENSDVPSYITFMNTTSRNVDVYWLDFKGQRVKYMEKFPQQRPHHINTFVTHPWMANDSITNDTLLLNGQRVFLPQAWDGNRERVLVNIHRPVYGLKNRCIQVLKDHYPNRVIPDLEIPRHLIEEMCRKPNTDYVEYKKMSRN